MTRINWLIKTAILAGSFMLGMVGYRWADEKERHPTAFN